MDSLLYLRLKGAPPMQRELVARDILKLFIPWYKDNMVSLSSGETLITKEYKVTHIPRWHVLWLDVEDIRVVMNFNPATDEIYG